MKIFKIYISDRDELEAVLDKVGCDKRSLPFFENRRGAAALYLPDVDVRAANTLKQEMLSAGGDAAVHKHAIDCGTKRSDVLFFGTPKQMRSVADKVGMMKWWDFPAIADELRGALSGCAARPAPAELPCGAALPFGERTLIMGIVNLTDDSFYAKSRAGGDADAAVSMAAAMVKGGADIIDLGAESTRPGADRVPEDEEIHRISSAVREIRKTLPEIPLSIDTTRTSVARAALAEGADIINDISGLTYEPDMADAAAEYGAMLVLMHMRGTPETMGNMCGYSHMLSEINEFFSSEIELALAHGLKRERIILDPGLGFAKTYEQNLYILRHTEAFRPFGLPLLIGASRKSFIGRATGEDDPARRLDGTVAVTSLCAWQGVEIVRVHDAAENKRAAMMTDAVKKVRCE